MYHQINDFTIYGKLEVCTMYFLLDKKAKIYIFFFKHRSVVTKEKNNFFARYKNTKLLYESAASK